MLRYLAESFSNLSKVNFNKLEEHQSMSFYCLAISMSNNRINVHTIENMKTVTSLMSWWCFGLRGDVHQ